MLELIGEIFLQATFYVFGALFELGVEVISIFYDFKKKEHSFIVRVFIAGLGGLVIAILLYGLFLGILYFS